MPVQRSTTHPVNHIKFNTNRMIYTLDYLRKEAQGIQAAWNGSDEKFIYDGDVFTEEGVNKAIELEQKLEEVQWLVNELGL